MTTDRVGGQRAGPARRRGVAGWFDPRGRRLGGWAFALNRLSGLGVMLYLYLHLVILSTLARGPEAWDDFVAFALNPAVLVFDVVLLAGLLVHGLNGIRVSLVGLGLLVDRQRALFVALMVVAAIVLLAGAARLFEVA
jgi:succinate dehydrogenase / fumarate reductase cytochrome b subunit